MLLETRKGNTIILIYILHMQKYGCILCLCDMISKFKTILFCFGVYRLESKFLYRES